MARAEIVGDVELGHHPTHELASLVEAEEFGDDAAQRLRAVVGAPEGDGGERVAQHPRRHGMPFRLIGVEQALGRNALHHLREFPAQIDRVLHARVEALSARRIVDVRRIARDQHASLAIDVRLPCRIGEA